MEEKEKELGFYLKKSNVGIELDGISDLDFANNNVLISEKISKAQIMLDRIKNDRMEIELIANTKKIQVTFFNHSNWV